jgi:hypothetical protein
MCHRSVFFALWAMLGWSMTGCLLAVREPDLTYNTSRDHVILYADVQPIPGGLPRGTTCRYDSIPRLRIWGDGLVFLDVSQFGVPGSVLWSGVLPAEQIQALLAFLQGQGFFNHRWTPSGANPAGTWLTIGSQLKSGTEEYSTGDLSPGLYQELISRIQPSLTPFTLNDLPDPRFNALHIGTRDCAP